MEFNVEYAKNKILCKNCKFSVTSNNPIFENTKTYYTNRKIYLIGNEYNQVEAKNNPTFELTFFDNYSNQMGEAPVQKLNVEASFVGINIKLCVTNSKDKKLFNLCPVSNGDDILNKWQY